MGFVASLSDLSHQGMKETWYNSSIMLEGLCNFFKSSASAVLDDCGYENQSEHLSAGRFLNYLDISIRCKPMEQLLSAKMWEKVSDKLYLGVWLDEEKNKQLAFYAWLELAESFQQDFFHRNQKANKLKSALSKDWDFEFDGEHWIIKRVKPVEEIDFSKPTWKRDLKRFYEECLTQISETIFKTGEWLD